MGIMTGSWVFMVFNGQGKVGNKNKTKTKTKTKRVV